MAKKQCVICGNAIGLLDKKMETAQGPVCMECLAGAGIASLKDPQRYDTQALAALLRTHKEIADSYQETKAVSNHLSLDENHRLFRIGGDIFPYESLVSFQMNEDGSILARGGPGIPVAESQIKSVHKNNCNQMSLELKLKEAHTDQIAIRLVTYKARTNGMIYRSARSYAEQCIEELLRIMGTLREGQTVEEAKAAQGSAAEEIRRFKELMDDGIITAEEFEAKKKQLLGL